MNVILPNITHAIVQDTFVKLDGGLSFFFYTLFAILGLLLLATLLFCCVCCFRCCLTSIPNKINRLEREYLRQYMATVSKTTAMNEKPTAPFVTYIFDAIFILENLLFVHSFFLCCSSKIYMLLHRFVVLFVVLMLIAAAGIGFNSYEVQYWGLGVSIAIAVILSIIVTAHAFRLRIIRRMAGQSQLDEVRSMVKSDTAPKKMASTNQLPTNNNSSQNTAVSSYTVPSSTNNTVEEASSHNDLDKDLQEQLLEFQNLIAKIGSTKLSNISSAGPSSRNSLVSSPSQMESDFDQEAVRRVASKKTFSKFAPEKHKCGTLCCLHPFEYYVRKVITGVKKRFLFFSIALLCVMGLVSVLILSSFGFCLCFEPFDASTSMTRLFLAYSCKPSTICFTYLNVAEDPSTQMIIKFHSNTRTVKSYVYYDTVNTTAVLMSNRVECTDFDMTTYTMDFQARKVVHTCDLTGLSPDTAYYFYPMVEYAQQRNASAPTLKISTASVKKFITLPSNPTSTIRVVNGGDMETYSLPLIKSAAQTYEPHLFIFGGDLVYENGQPTCYQRFDVFFNNYESIAVAPSTKAMIPMLTSVGNHEAKWALFSQPLDSVLNYLVYFKHRISNSSILPLKYNDLLHSHIIGGHTRIVVLDSGVVIPHEAQKKYIADQFSSATPASVVNQIAVYHAPLYPSVRDFDGIVSKMGRTHWEPLFNDLNVDLCLEHHDHAQKRTKRIATGGQIVGSGGVVYIGDGSMGVAVRHSDPSRDYLETTDGVTHYWYLTFSSSGIQGRAINGANSTFDTFSLP